MKSQRLPALAFSLDPKTPNSWCQPLPLKRQIIAFLTANLLFLAPGQNPLVTASLHQTLEFGEEGNHTALVPKKLSRGCGLSSVDTALGHLLFGMYRTTCSTWIRKGLVIFPLSPLGSLQPKAHLWDGGSSSLSPLLLLALVRGAADN